MRSTGQAAAVFLACFLLFGYGADHFAIGAGYLDPVGRIDAQDESVYSHIALRWAERGDWLTPVFLDRFFLYKPPLLYWLSGASARIFGATAWALRLPSLIAAALVCMLVFVMVREEAGTWRGVLAAALTASSPLFYTLARRNLTDALLTLAITAAMYLLWRDPAMWSVRTSIGFGIAVGLGVLAKSVAGLLPLLMASVVYLLTRLSPKLTSASPELTSASPELTSASPELTSVSPKPSRDREGAVPKSPSEFRWTSAWIACFTALLVAAPWFLYQSAVHSRWFWGEFVNVELLAHGVSAPPQTSSESQAGFYAARLWKTDPWLTVLAIAGLLAMAVRRERKTPSDAILLAWIGVAALAPLVFQYRNATYLMPLIPALALVAGLYVPLPAGRRSWLAGLAAGSLLLGKLLNPGAAWGLAPAGEPPPSVNRLLERYCGMQRGNDLVVLQNPDHFYATVLPLEKVRYALQGAAPPPGTALPFPEMGIIVTKEQFLDLDKLRPGFKSELRAWGLPDDRAVATVILYRDPGDLGDLIRRSPAIDFVVPAEIGPRVLAEPRLGHSILKNTQGDLLLLGDLKKRTQLSNRACRAGGSD